MDMRLDPSLQFSDWRIFLRHSRIVRPVWRLKFVGADPAKALKTLCLLLSGVHSRFVV